MDTPLSPREREVLDLIAQGYHNQEIADELHVSLQRVKNCLIAIFDKTGTRNRAEAAVWCVRHGGEP